MKFNTLVKLSSLFYKISKKVGSKNDYMLDELIDNYFPQILSELQSFLKYDKIAFSMTNGKKTTVDIFNQILSAMNKTYTTNVSREGKIYPCLSSILLDIDRSLRVFKYNNPKDYYTMAFNSRDLVKYFNSIKFDYLLLGNMFVNQNNRIDLVEKRKKIQEAIILNSKINLIINADDPFYNSIDEIENDTGINTKRNKIYYGFSSIEVFEDNENYKQDNDLIVCPKCNCELTYQNRYYSHLGHYNCECGFKRPKLDIVATAKIFSDYSFLDVTYKDEKYSFRIPLGSIYNAYNALGAISLALVLGFERKIINQALENYSYMKSRDEIISYNDKKIKLKIIKNPTSLTEASREIALNKKTKVVFILSSSKNENSNLNWIWNSNLEVFKNVENKIYICGDKCDDMALKLKYSSVNPSFIVIDSSIKNTLECSYWELEKDETLLILSMEDCLSEIYKFFKK